VGLIDHALIRVNARMTISASDDDYAAVQRVLSEALARADVRLLAYFRMPNHFDLLLWARDNGDVSRFPRWLTVTHTQRWHAHHGTAGTGHFCQSRFKSFPVQFDDHFLAVCRSVERNALRTGLVERAAEWRWGQSPGAMGEGCAGPAGREPLADRLPARLVIRSQAALRADGRGGRAAKQTAW